MLKTLRLSVGIMVAVCLLNPTASSAQNCGALRVASSNLYLTNTPQALKVQAANNQDTQIFKVQNLSAVNSQGEAQIRLTPMANNPNETLAVIESGTKGVIGTYDGSAGHRWNKQFIEQVGNDRRYGLIRSSGSVAMGVENWGNGNPGAPTVSDVNMIPSSDVPVFGANKWIFEAKTCPAQSSSCEYLVLVSSTDYNPGINESFTLTGACYGPGCSGVTYKWAPDAIENGMTGTVLTTSLSTAKTVNYFLKSEKPGCSTRYGNAFITSSASTPAGCNYDINFTADNYNPIVGSEVLLSANCTGPDCGGGGFTYGWAPMNDGVGSLSSTFKVIAGYANGNVGYQWARVSVSKQGCTTQTRDLALNVLPNSGRMGVQEEVIAIGEERLNISPNPSNGDFTVDFFLETGKSGDLTVVDMQGKVLQKRILTGRGNHREKIELGDKSPSGTYLVRILKENGQEVKKAVIVK